jgi:oxygen-independent coproporphyrinogen-3 oxidase
LQKLGRPHNYDQAVTAVERIRRAGFKNLSLDLMYGLPGQTLESWEKTLRRVLTLNPEHMSCYGLKVEERTPLYQYKDICNLPDDDTQADMYLAAVEILRTKGYRQYEISNFAKKGLVSKHNMKYWTGGEYLGFGPDASSDFGGKRFTIVRDLMAYIDGIKNGGQVISEISQIPHRERAGEYLMTRLRTVSGIHAEEYEKRYLLPFAPLEEVMNRYAKQRYASKAIDGRWYLTPEGFLISNTIITDLLLAQEKTVPATRE